MKRIAAAAAIAVMLLSLVGCAEKTRAALDIKRESVSSVEFKRTCYSDDEPEFRAYVSKKVTEASDIDKLIAWATDLRLTKQKAIEIPVENVEFVMVLNGTKEHKLIFMGDYVIFDAVAYTYDRAQDKSLVREKYNMLNYEENSAELDLIG